MSILFLYLSSRLFYPSCLVFEASRRAAAVVAVTLFGRIAPDDFGVFDKALITLFYVTGGDPWPEALPRVNEDGTANWVVAGFVMTFTIMVVWIILEVKESDRLSFSNS